MERAGGQRKRPNIWQIPAIPRYEYAETPPKSGGFERRRLSLRSENTATITEATTITTTTAQSSTLLSRQATGLPQKQPGKENESPFFIQDHAAGGKLRAATITKSTIKRKNPLNHINFITNPEKKIIRRRLSSDYDEQLSTSNKFHQVTPIEPIVFSSTVVQPASRGADFNNRNDHTQRFSVYDDSADVDSAGRDVNETISESRDISEYDSSAMPRNLSFLWKSYQRYKSREEDRAASISKSAEEKMKTEKSSATQPEFLDPLSALDDQEISTVEFRIERVDRRCAGGGGTPAIGNYRKVKSGSDIGRLNVPLRKGEDISPLKRRINQLKKSGMIVGLRCKGGKEGATASVVTDDNLSNLKIGLKSMEEVRKLNKSAVPRSRPDREEVEKYDLQKSSMDPSTGAIQKPNRYASPEVRRRFTENITTREEAQLNRMTGHAVKDQSVKSNRDVVESLSASTRKKSAAGSGRLLSEPSSPKSCSTSSMEKQRGQRQSNAIIDEHPVPRFCQPTLRDKSSGLKDDFIEFVYDDPVGDRQDKPKSTNDNIFQNYSSLRDSVYNLIIATVVKAPRPVERERSAENKPAFAGCPRSKEDAAQLGQCQCPEINGDSKFDREIDCTDSCKREKNFSDQSHTAAAKFKDELKSSSSTGIACAPRMQTVIKRQPAIVTNGDGSRKIARGVGIILKERTEWPSRKRTLVNITAVATPTFYPGGTSHRIPVTDARKLVRPNRKIGTEPESRSIKSAGKIPGLFHDSPLEIQYATDYTEQTIDIEHAREGYCHKISHTFLKGRTVTTEQRRIVVNFLISVHAYLLTSSSTLYQATKMFDAILDIKDVSVKELQIVALGALWIAIKNMETRTPTASEMISFAKDMYNAEGPRLLCKCERKILKTLGFNIRFPDPFYISAYYLQQWSSLGTVADKPSILKAIYHCAGYLMDVALLDENYSGMPSELLAIAATRTAVHLVVINTPWDSLVKQSPWNNEKFTGYTQEEIDRVVGPLLNGVLDSAEENSPIGAVYKKYKNVRYGNMSDYLIVKIRKLPGLSRKK